MADQPDQPDYGPPISPGLLDIVNRLGGLPASYAQARLGRTPVIYAKDRAQYEDLTNPKHDVAQEGSHGATFMRPGDLSLLSWPSPLYGAARDALSDAGTVAVIAPYQRPIGGPGGTLGTEPGVATHEASHAYFKGLPLDQIVSRLPSATQAKLVKGIEDLAKSYHYPPENIPGEVAVRLVAGQFGSLGLNESDGLQARQELLSAMQQFSAQKAERARLYTQGRGQVDMRDRSGSGDYIADQSLSFSNP